ncbi:ankyrin repeat-containing domain protein [Aspergillus spectabilis]
MLGFSCVDSCGSTALNLAIRREREDLVRDVLDQGGLDINAASTSGWTALHTTAHYSCVETIELLLAQDGIDADQPTSSGQTPLMRARYYLSMEPLLAHPGVKVDHVDDLGRSALSYAAERADLSAGVLLKHGARPDLKDSSGETPISRAVTAKQGDMVKLLEIVIAPN